MERVWGNEEEMQENEEMKRDSLSLHFLILSLFPSSLSISYIKIYSIFYSISDQANVLSCFAHVKTNHPISIAFLKQKSQDWPSRE